MARSRFEYLSKGIIWAMSRECFRRQQVVTHIKCRQVQKRGFFGLVATGHLEWISIGAGSAGQRVVEGVNWGWGCGGRGHDLS